MAKRKGTPLLPSHSGGAVPDSHRSSLFVGQSSRKGRPPTHVDNGNIQERHWSCQTATLEVCGHIPHGALEGPVASCRRLHFARLAVTIKQRADA